LATGAVRRVLRGHRGDINGAHFAPDSQSLASVDSLGEIRLWSVTSDEVEVFHGHDKGVRGIVFSPDGASLVSTGFDGTIRVWPGRLPHQRPTDPAGLHAWMDQVTSATIDAAGRVASPPQAP
jgi:WD40 repeat protein